MRNLDDFLDPMAEQDEDHRAVRNFLAEARAEHSRVLAEARAISHDHQVRCFALVRKSVRKMADAGLTPQQIAEEVDRIFKN